MDIQKEFDRWWNTFKSQATRQYPVKAAREAWAACATLMSDRVKELEAEIKELKFAYDTSHNADQFLIKTARTKVIKGCCKDCKWKNINHNDSSDVYCGNGRLKQANGKWFEIPYNVEISCSEFLSKLDLLSEGKQDGQ
jgi:hypothetical protein